MTFKKKKKISKLKTDDVSGTEGNNMQQPCLLAKVIWER